jgi:hypothetical protein
VVTRGGGEFARRRAPATRPKGNVGAGQARVRSCALAEGSADTGGFDITRARHEFGSGAREGAGCDMAMRTAFDVDNVRDGKSPLAREARRRARHACKDRYFTRRFCLETTTLRRGLVRPRQPLLAIRDEESETYADDAEPEGPTGQRDE